MTDFGVEANHQETEELLVQSQGSLCISDSALSSESAAVLPLPCVTRVCSMGGRDVAPL